MSHTLKMDSLPEDILEIIVVSVCKNEPFASALALRRVSRTWNTFLTQLYLSPLLQDTRIYLETMLISCASRRFLLRTLGRRQSATEWGWCGTSTWIQMDADMNRCTARTNRNTQCARRALRNDPLRMCCQHRDRTPYCRV